MSRTRTWLMLTLFLSGGWLFSQTPPTSSNNQTPDASNSAETTRQDVGILHALADATEKSAEGQTRVKGFGNGLLLWDYWSAKTLSEEDRAGFALGTSLSQQLFLEDDPALAWLGLIAPVAERAGLLQKTEIEKMEDNAYLNGFVTPEPVLTPISSGGTVINIQLVSDSPQPTNGITIEPPQFVANPSPDGIEVAAPSASTSIVSSLLPNPSRPMAISASSGGSHFDWAGFLSDVNDVFQAAAPIIESVQQAKQSANIQSQKTAPNPRTKVVCADDRAVWAAPTPGAFLAAAIAWPGCKIVPENQKK